MVAQIDPSALDGLPRFNDMEELSRGAKGDAVKQLQDALKAAGFLQGSADGDYGGGTEKAIIALQSDIGLEGTGVADIPIQMLALSLGQPEVQIDATIDTVDYFASIAGRTNLDTQLLTDSGLFVDYDDIASVGFISDGTALTYDASGESDLDLYQLSLRFGLSLRDLEDGTMDVQPVIQVNCRCVQRPVLTEIMLKSGSLRGTAKIGDLSVSLDGVCSLEKGTAILDEQLVTLLAGALDAGELKLRVNGRYKTFDIAADASTLASIARIAGIAQTIQG